MTLSSEGSHFCFVLLWGFFFSSHFVSNFQFLHHHNHQAQPQAVFPLISVSLGCDCPPLRLPKPPRGGEGRGFPPPGSWVIKTTYRANIFLAKPKCFAAAVLLWPCCFSGGSLGSNLCFDSAHFHQTLESCEVVNHCSQMFDRKK